MNSESLYIPNAEIIKMIMPADEHSCASDNLVEKALAGGSQLFGESDPVRNREASGIYNHTLKSSRFGVFIAQRINALEIEGLNVDIGVIGNGHLVSHSGRLIWDYADTETKRLLVETYGSNEWVGVELLRMQNASSNILQMVQALAHGGRMPQEARDYQETLEFKIAEYVDHRTDQTILPLQERMSDLIVRTFLKSKNQLGIIQHVHNFVEAVIIRAKESEDITGEVAAQMLNGSDYFLNEARGFTLADILQFVINDARFEKYLEDLGLTPKMWEEFDAALTVDNVKNIRPDLLPDSFVLDQDNPESLNLWKERTNNLVAPPRWERYLRRLSIASSEAQLFKQLYKAKTGNVMLLLNDDGTIFNELGMNSSRKWWDDSVDQLYKSNHGVAGTVREESHKTLNEILPRNSIGANRALKYFRYYHMSGSEKGKMRRRIKLIRYHQRKNI